VVPGKGASAVPPSPRRGTDLARQNDRYTLRSRNVGGRQHRSDFRQQTAPTTPPPWANPALHEHVLEDKAGLVEQI